LTASTHIKNISDRHAIENAENALSDITSVRNHIRMYWTLVSQEYKPDRDKSDRYDRTCAYSFFQRHTLFYFY
jgi:hypothetical protein